MSEVLEQQADEQAVRPAVSRVLAAPPIHVWEVLMSEAGAEALLGHGANLGTKGQSWHSDEGPMGVVRSIHPLEQLRVSWHETPEAPRTMVELDLTADGEGTRVDLIHSGYAGDIAADVQRWNAALDRFESALG